MPGMMPHLSVPGSPDALGMLLDGVFPPGTDGRIPLAAIAGSDRSTGVCRMVAAMLEAAGHVVGLATGTAVSVGGASIVAADLAEPAGAKMVLRDATVTAAVLETRRDAVFKYGLGFDRCHVGAVLASDGTASDGIESSADLARLTGLVARVATEMAVLNADDPLCRDLAAMTQARQLCWVTSGSPDPSLQAHIAAGRPAVSLGHGAGGPEILLWAAGNAVPVANAGNIAARHGGGGNFAGALFAVAIAHGLGLAPAVVAAALTDTTGEPE
jgi:cyanophycin synthetase